MRIRKFIERGFLDILDETTKMASVSDIVSTIEPTITRTSSISSSTQTSIPAIIESSKLNNGYYVIGCVALFVVASATAIITWAYKRKPRVMSKIPSALGLSESDPQPSIYTARNQLKGLQSDPCSLYGPKTFTKRIDIANV
jgi:hypothetical protein